MYCELCQDVEKLFVANLCGWLLSAKESRTAKARLLLMYWSGEIWGVKSAELRGAGKNLLTELLRNFFFFLFLDFIYFPHFIYSDSLGV